MAAPTVANSQVASANTTTALTLTGVSAGDLIIVAGFFQLADPGISLALTDGAAATVGTSAEQGVASHADATSITIANRFVFIYSILVTSAPASGTVTCTFTNWPSSGASRRWACMAVTPPSGRTWGANRKARQIDHSTAALVDSNTHTSVGFTTLATAKQEDNPCIVIDGQFGNPTTSFSADWNLDGTGNTAPDPTAEWVQAGSNPHGGFAYSLYDASQFMGQSGKNAANEPTIIKYLFAQATGYANGVGFLYAVEGAQSFKNGRGNAAAKAAGRGGLYRITPGRGRAAAKASGAAFNSAGVTRLTDGRGRAASAGLGQAHVFNTRRSGPTRAAAAARGTPFNNRREDGRGRGVSSASSSGFIYVAHAFPGAGQNACAATGRAHLFVFHRSGRARAAARAVSAPFSSLPILREGRSYGASKAAGQFVHTQVRPGRARAASVGSGNARHGATRAGNARAAGAAHGQGLRIRLYVPQAQAAARATGQGFLSTGPVPRSITLTPATSTTDLRSAQTDAVFV